MRLVKLMALTIIVGYSLIASAWGGDHKATKTYSDAHIQFSYPENRYLRVSSAETEQSGFYAYFLQLKNEDEADLITVCMKGIKDCGTNMGMVQPYWYSEDGTLMLFSATTAVKTKRNAQGEIVFEAFPACPATDHEGSSAYGGDCYVVVKAEKDRTLSMTYWIGPTSLHHSKSEAVREAMAILKSIRTR
ncbi:hypothetical protein LMG28688_06152 [Paraburkholderia caffeinitolerans]|uniref:DUF4136 domain-containing protein n=1 Tax=Paraburkholderia caffeinitolerans TaxID=1723730 RepID=A0A6J5GUY0_9BURK|nr:MULTISPECIES: hypothetical protein [Paraburkholderia]CAB3805318.1 hypothetical protein LMG28688_06152 [Paraburkholderia caffeinitolerans]